MLKLSKIAIPRTSLRLNLMVVCETLLLLFLSLAVLLYFSRQALKDEAKHDAEETLEGTVQHIDNILMSVEQSAYITYEDLKGHLNEPDRMVTYCREVVKNNPYVGGCAIAFKPHYFPGHEFFMKYVHQTGSHMGEKILVTSDKFGNLPYTKQIWYTMPMSKGRPIWTDPLIEEEDEGVTLSFCIPIKDHEECVGVIVVDLPIALLSQIILDATPLPHSYSILLSSNGLYIVHPDKEKLTGQEPVLTRKDAIENPSVREAAQAMLAGETGSKPFQLHNKDWYVIYKPFQRAKEFGMPMEKLGWSAGMIYLEDDIMGDYNFLTYLVLITTIVGFLIFYGLCHMLIRQQLKPLRLLTRSAHRVAEGYYDETVPNTQREDEIGRLQDHFQKMQQSLTIKSKELEQLTSRLTKRGEELRKAYGQAQGSDRMKTTFLNYMTSQMTVPADLIEKSIIKLCNHYEDLSPQEADYEVGVIKKQSEIVLDLLDHMIEALEIEAEEQKASLESRKEATDE